jgi:hypothetical protein
VIGPNLARTVGGSTLTNMLCDQFFICEFVRPCPLRGTDYPIKVTGSGFGTKLPCSDG